MFKIIILPHFHLYSSQLQKMICLIKSQLNSYCTVHVYNVLWLIKKNKEYTAIYIPFLWQEDNVTHIPSTDYTEVHICANLSYHLDCEKVK